MNVLHTFSVSDQESFSGLFYKPSYASFLRVECLMFYVSGVCVYLVLENVVRRFLQPAEITARLM